VYIIIRIYIYIHLNKKGQCNRKSPLKKEGSCQDLETTSPTPSGGLGENGSVPPSEEKKVTNHKSQTCPSGESRLFCSSQEPVNVLM